jgi:hypothetical protein
MRVLPDKAIPFNKRKCPECGGKFFHITWNIQKHLEGSYEIVPDPRGLACHGCEATWIDTSDRKYPLWQFWEDYRPNFGDRKPQDRPPGLG